MIFHDEAMICRYICQQLLYDSAVVQYDVQLRLSEVVPLSPSQSLSSGPALHELKSLQKVYLHCDEEHLFTFVY